MSKIILEDERAILEDVSRGNKNAFKVLYDNFSPSVFKVALHLLKDKEQADDIVQDIFIKLWSVRKTLPNVDSIENYLFIITRNTIFTYLKKQIRNAKSAPLWLNDISITENNFEINVEQKEYERIIVQSIQLLPPQQKQVYLLFEEEKMSYEQIASSMKLSKQTVKRHLALARKFIREYCSKRLYILLVFFLINF